MPFFKWGKKKKNAAQEGAMTKSGRFIAPTGETAKPPVSQTPAPAAQPPVDDKVKDTISQIDIEIPGMVVLRSKEERHIARLTEDLKAQEEYTRSIQRGEVTPADNSPAAASAGNESDDDATIVLAANLLLKSLMAKGLITPEQADETEDYAIDNGLSIAEALNTLAILSPQQLGEYISGECQVPLSNLDELRIQKSALNILSVDDIRNFELIPLSKVGSTLNIAAVNPMNNRMLDRLRTEMGFDVKCVVCTAGALQNTIRKYYA